MWSVCKTVNANELGTHTPDTNADLEYDAAAAGIKAAAEDRYANYAVVHDGCAHNSGRSRSRCNYLFFSASAIHQQ